MVLTAEEVIAGLDIPLFKKQREAFNEVVDKIDYRTLEEVAVKHKESLLGLQNFLDALYDSLVTQPSDDEAETIENEFCPVAWECNKK